MSKSTIPVHVCDRCKTRQELRNSHEEYTWGEFWAAQCNGPIWFGSQKRHDKTLDLCPECIDDLRDWFEAPTRPPADRADVENTESSQSKNAFKSVIPETRKSE